MPANLALACLAPGSWLIQFVHPTLEQWKCKSRQMKAEPFLFLAQSTALHCVHLHLQQLVFSPCKGGGFILRRSVMVLTLKVRTVKGFGY